jgi:hypothetical protein
VSPDEVLDQVEAAAGGVKSEPRMTHREWRAFARARRAWDRRAVCATGAVVLAEVAAAVAWTAWTSAMNAPRPRLGR